MPRNVHSLKTFKNLSASIDYVFFHFHFFILWSFQIIVKRHRSNILHHKLIFFFFGVYRWLVYPELCKILWVSATIRFLILLPFVMQWLQLLSRIYLLCFQKILSLPLCLKYKVNESKERTVKKSSFSVNRGNLNSW